MKKLIYILIAALFVLGISSCTNQRIKKADKEYTYKHYQKAIVRYQKVVKKKQHNHATINLANSYFYTNDIANAKLYYKDAVYMAESGTEEYLNYARVLMQDEEYKEAKVWLNKVLETEPNNMVAKVLLASCNSIDDFYRDTTLYEVNEVTIEGFENVIGSTELNDGIVFSGDKEAGMMKKESSWTGNTYLNLYFTEKDINGQWLNPELLKGDINGRYHEGPADFTKDGQHVYFTRNNYKKRKLNDKSEGENNLKIYTAELVGDKWTNVEELSFNNDLYSTGHPTLSSDENTLYFISDMPGGLGGTDIWYVTKEGESWSEPVNLGEPVNAHGNEMFPYFHKDGSLYFSSDSHNSLGGLDVFITSKVDGKWLTPENLNYPLNSSKDDFGFVMSNDDSTGYVASSRSENDAMYKFVKRPPNFFVYGVITSIKSTNPLSNVKVTLSNVDGKVIEEFTTSSSGKYRFKIPLNSEVKVHVSKKGFFATSSSMSTVGEKYSKDFEVNLELDELIIEKPILVENIYYDYDKWFIREDAKPALNNLVKLMEDNPAIVIELSSHTDARASGRYNLILSDKRAHAVVEYIISKGIDRSRITAKGYGETKLINECKNNVECSEEKHQENRRTEFKVTKLMKK